MDTFRHPVTCQVDLILEDVRFKASDRLRRLLRFLADRAVCGASPPTQQEIATQVLGLTEDFDAVSDSRIRVEVLRLRQALDTYNDTLRPEAPRLTLPRGEYTLRLTMLSAPDLRFPKSDAGIPVLISVNHPQDQQSDEQLAFCVNEALQLCATSPLVGLGRLSLHLVDVYAGGDPTLEARRIEAQAVLSLRARGRGAAFSVCATATAMPSNCVLASVHAGAATPACTGAEATKNAARDVAAVIADPFTGIARNLLEVAFSPGGFRASQVAYEYIRTQKIEHAQQAWDLLVDVRSRCPTDATTLALLADMSRVLTTAEQHAAPSYAQALDLAEEAVLLDPENAAARLSLGYAQLASRDFSGAARAARQLEQGGLFGSILDDARLLSVLSGHDSPNETTDPMHGSGTFIGLVSKVLHHLDQNEVSAAAEALDISRHDSIFWTQLFRILVMQTLGETELACQSAKQLNTLCPEFRSNSKNMVRSFFGERNLGLQLEECYKQVAPVD